MTLVTNVIGIKSESRLVQALQAAIRKRGAPNHLLSDPGQVEVSEKVKEVHGIET